VGCDRVRVADRYIHVLDGVDLNIGLRDGNEVVQIMWLFNDSFSDDGQPTRAADLDETVAHAVVEIHDAIESVDGYEDLEHPKLKSDDPVFASYATQTTPL
jgi:hypothetical protein